MRSICVFVISLLAFSYVNAQEFHVEWTKFIGGANDHNTLGQFAISTHDKGILFTGYTNCSNSGDMPDFVFGASIYANIVVGKIDSTGQLSWIKILGGSQNDYGVGLCQSEDGSFYVLSSTLSGDGDVTGFKGTEDVWVVKLDSLGGIIWEKCYGSSYAETGISIAATADGGVIVLGTSNGSGGDVPSHYTASEFVLDWLVLKIDSAGTLQWSKSLGGNGDELLYGSILVADGGYYLASSSASTDHECTDTGWHAHVNTGYDYYLLKLDATGNMLWNRSFGGTGSDFLYNAIWDTRDSSLVMTGASTHDDYMATGSSGGVDIFTVKTDHNGNLIWAHKAGAISDETGMSLLPADAGGYIVYATTEPNPNSTPYIGNNDTWISVLDSNGHEIGRKIFGGADDDRACAIVNYQYYFATLGYSLSQSFTEGSNLNRQGTGRDLAISYVDYFPSGVSDKKKTTSLAVYPNPTKGTVRIAITQANDAYLQISDNLGRTIYRQKIKDGYTEVNTSNWPRGMYYVELRAGDKNMTTQKLLLQ